MRNRGFGPRSAVPGCAVHLHGCGGSNGQFQACSLEQRRSRLHLTLAVRCADLSAGDYFLTDGLHLEGKLKIGRSLISNPKSEIAIGLEGGARSMTAHS